MELTGGCLCGGTRYELKGAPFSLGDCHCIDCRRSAGAPVVTWGSVYRKDLHMIKGEPRKIQRAGRIRSFAACCGTHLFFEETNDSETVDVTIASLDDPTRFAPQKVDLAGGQIAPGQARPVAPAFPEGLGRVNRSGKYAK